MSQSFNFGDCSFVDDDEWEESIAEQNRQLDRIIEDVAIQATTLSLQPTNHQVRATRRYIERIHEKGHDSVFEKYFAENPIYPDDYFRMRYRIRKPLFLRIMNKLVETDEFFQQKPDAAGRRGMSAIQKCTVAMRVLAYGTSADLHDEYLRISAQLIRKSVVKFVEGVISNFRDEYLRKSTKEDTTTLLHVRERGFPGMLGSIDCMHWKWKNCPSSWAEQYTGRGMHPTIILEAVASQDLWIWHAFFGTPGLRNDINVLNHSPVFDDIPEGQAPEVNYVVNGHEKNMGYYLTDGIYPQWAIFVKSIPAPQIPKHQLFAQFQEAARKDIERTFSILQARFAFIKVPCLIWDRDIMGKIMIACIIMHSMIVEDERNTYLNYQDPTKFIEDLRRWKKHQTENEEESMNFYTLRTESQA